MASVGDSPSRLGPKLAIAEPQIGAGAGTPLPPSAATTS